MRLHLPVLPYETKEGSTSPKGLVAGCALFVTLTILEVLAFTVGVPFSSTAAYIWFAIGTFSFVYLCWRYISALISDLRHGAIWGLLPLAAAIPMCFFFTDSFAFLNTESLSELHDTYEQLQQPDRAYTAVFWFSYPSRSLILNLVPTALFGITPWSYRVGFSYPILFGALFLFTGIRRFHLNQRGASAVAGLVAAGLFTYPMFCQISRSFEMAISSTGFGLWAIAALFLFATEPTIITAVIAAWTIGLLSASFTSGLALVALLWVLLGLWAARAYVRRDRAVAALVSVMLLNCVVVGTALYLIRPRTLRAKQIPFSDMLNNFYEALHYTLSFSQPVFTATALVIPTVLAIVFAVSLRGGWLPLLLTGWCFPVIWSATNLHGKIGPQLPFALYRSLIIIPVALYVIGRMLLWVISRLERLPWVARTLPVLLAIGLYFPLMATYRTQPIFIAPRPPEGREVIAYEILQAIERAGLSPWADAWIADRTDEKAIENFLPCFQYFLLGWNRVERGQTLPPETAEPKKPGVIVTMLGDPLTSRSFPGYRSEVTSLPMSLSRASQTTLSVVVLRPE